MSPVFAVVGLIALLFGTPPRSAATSVVDTAIERMGGAPALRAIRTAKYEMITQWLSTSFDARPFQDTPNYELHSELRDYTTRTWRNKRRFPSGAGYSEINDLVLDTIAAREGGPSAPGLGTPVGAVEGGWSPLSIAYIDERREAFAFSPERVLLNVRDASDLRALADTTIGGIRHAVVTATIDGYPARVFLRQTDGFPAMVRYHADESNDYGLAPWGPMDVEVWYSRWRYDANAQISYPQQWDVRRVGRPYKRMSIVGAWFNVALPTDSLVLHDAVRTAYLTHARRPMGDVPLDSARLLGNGRIAVFFPGGMPGWAVRTGDSWLLLEPGNLPFSAERASAWLASHAGGKVTGGVVGGAYPSGGAAWLARQQLPVYVPASGLAATTLSLRNFGAPSASLHLVSKGEWLRSKGDSVWLEPIDLPNAPQSMLVYVPSMKWAFSSRNAGPIEASRIAEVIRGKGWTLERIGSPAEPEGKAAP